MGRAKRHSATAPTLDAGTPTLEANGRTARTSALEIGSRLGERYEIRGYLGEGGMGAVYRAFDEVLGVDVALKSVRGMYATDASLRDEVRIAQQVTHPNVCRIYDLVDVDGRHFIKMEYIAGETLAERIANGPLGLAETSRIAHGVADGLAAAHKKSIIHADLKPSNVMLAGDRVVLMDFGLARAVADTTKDRSGTPSYMAPEQLNGTEVDGRADLFALGCLVYEMLTGSRAYALGNGSYETVVRQRLALPKPVLKGPRPIARAVDELLAEDRELRRVGLARLVRIARGPRRGLRVALLLATLVAFGAVAWWLTRPPAPWEPRIEKVLAYTGNADQTALSPDGTTLLLTQDAENANQWSVWTVPAGGGQLRQISPPGLRCGYGRWSRDGASVLMMCRRDGVDAALRVPAEGGEPISLGVGIPADDCGDALLIVVREEIDHHVLLQTADGRRQTLVKERFIARARCSPSGKEVGLVVLDHEAPAAGALVLVDRTGKRETLVGGGVAELAFTEQGTILYIEQHDPLRTTLSEIDLASRRVWRRVPGEQNVRAPEPSRDSSTLLFHRDITWVPIFQLAQDGQRSATTLQQERLAHVVPVPGGKLLLADRARLDTFDVISVELATHAVKPLAVGVTPFPSHDGSHAYFATRHDPPRLARVALAGGAVEELATLPGTLVTGVDTSDGIQVLTRTPRGPALWMLATGGSLLPSSLPGLVLPSPSGWRAVWSGSPRDGQVALVPPGAELATPQLTLRDVSGRPAWIDARHLSYCDRATCKVRDVVTGQEQLGPKNPVNHPGSITAGLDGQRWFFNPTMGQVSLHRITNFRDRR